MYSEGKHEVSSFPVQVHSRSAHEEEGHLTYTVRAKLLQILMGPFGELSYNHIA